MSEHYEVHLAKDVLGFSAAHFITLGHAECEPLHGHTYHVGVEIRGSLDEHHCVVDFLLLRKLMTTLLEAWDHRVLLPTESLLLRVKESKREVEVTFGERRWIFPRADCVLLPVANTTTEMLARELARGLCARLESQLGEVPGRVRVEVDEGDGQSALFTTSRQ